MVEIVKIKYFNSMKNESLIANEEKVLDITDDVINEHSFFNELVTTNVSSSDILITPDNNSSKAFIVPAKGSFIWGFKDDNFKYSSLKYKELSGNAVSADNIYFLVIKKRFELVKL